MKLRMFAALLVTLWLVPLVATPAGGLPPKPPSAAQTKTALAKLTVGRAGSLAGYSRQKFGGHWATTTGGCDVRERVLQRDGRGVRVGAGCRVTKGRWRSLYDGKVLRTARKVDIDHVVSLADAWRSGARRWTARRRERFANDLRDPQLIAVSASSNRSKGDSGPQEWKPRRPVWCLYARWWVDVKTIWALTITRAEKRALRSMLDTCP